MTKAESDLIITEQNKSTEEILKAVAKVKSDYHELCKLKDKRIADLEKENAELKELIKNIIRVTWGEGWNYSLDWKVKAEQFLNEVEK